MWCPMDEYGLPVVWCYAATLFAAGGAVVTLAIFGAWISTKLNKAVDDD